MKKISQLRQRILGISKKHGLSHIGSNLSCLPVLMEIYEKKKPKDLVILDNAHAHLAHLVVKEEYDKENAADLGYATINIEKTLKNWGIHCDKRAGCDASGGSLGHGLGIAIGRSLSNQNRDVYVIVSDGSMMEGSNWEALRIIGDLELTNIHIYTNFNGYSAVDEVDTGMLTMKMIDFVPTIDFRYTKNGKGFEGIDGHYKMI